MQQGSMSRHTRSLFAQFRLGILPIKIETGRFSRQELENRTCDVCTSGEIEDEVHFLCICLGYSVERTYLFDKAKAKNDNFNNLQDVDKLIYLMNELWWDVSKFIVKAWHTRMSKVYC